MPKQSLDQPQSPDFALLQRTSGSTAERSRWTLAWLLGLLLLVVGAVVTLVLYLHTFETEEEQRLRSADAQWLEQSVQFHFRRLEDDMTFLARQAVVPTANVRGKLHSPASLQGGLLWRQVGVVLSHGWVPAGGAGDTSAGPQQWEQDWAAHPANAQVLGTLQDISRGLRRSAYAGPMRLPDGSLSDVVWLAVPFFERGQFSGNYLAALSMQRAAQGLVPDWFEQSQKVRWVADGMDTAPAAQDDANLYRASMNLPGTELFLEVAARSEPSATVPRMFFLMALFFLLGMLISLYALRRDFVKRQKIQARLQSEVALRTAIENSATTGLRAWDMNGKILYVNDAFCRMVGYPSPALLGKSAPLPYWPADQTNELNLVHRNIIAKGTRSEGVEVQFQHSDGKLIDVLIHEAPLNTADGARLGWMSSVQDISERKRAQRVAAKQQEKLEASGRLVAVGEVASTLAHELNQPLGALSSFASGLLNRLHKDNITLQELVPVVTRMAGLAQRAGGIIQRVNAFARRREISLQRMNLTPTVRRVLSGTAHVQTRHLTLMVGKEPIWVQADELLIEHLIGNLVGNALDWADRGGRSAHVKVELLSDAQQHMAVLCVSDSGPGVPEEEQATIFDAFFSTKDGGMGMGLAICRSIVEAHHGRIDVARDEALGGAKFTVWLPHESIGVL